MSTDIMEWQRDKKPIDVCSTRCQRKDCKVGKLVPIHLHSTTFDMDKRNNTGHVLSRAT